jgi:hypothetical protein
VAGSFILYPSLEVLSDEPQTARGGAARESAPLPFLAHAARIAQRGRAAFLEHRLAALRRISAELDALLAVYGMHAPRCFWCACPMQRNAVTCPQCAHSQPNGTLTHEEA